VISTDSPDQGHCATNFVESVTVQTDVASLSQDGVNTPVTCLVTVKFADDDDAQPVHLPSDQLWLLDISGSMDNQNKLSTARSQLLKLASLVSPLDRVSFVVFDDAVEQLTPLEHLTPDALARLRAHLLRLSPRGGTDIKKALRAVAAVANARACADRPLQVLLVTDGQDDDARTCFQTDGFLNSLSTRAISWSCLGLGADHDATLCAQIARNGNGSYLYVENEQLGEELAGWVGDTSRAHAQRVACHLSPSEGTRVVGVDAPGNVTLLPDGGALVTLGAARVNESRELLFSLLVTGDDAPTLHVNLTASEPLGQYVTLLPLLGGAPSGDALAAAHNRQTLRLAAEAVAAVAVVDRERPSTRRRADAPEETLTASVLAYASSQLQGSEAVRETTRVQLTQLATQAEACTPAALAATASVLAHAATSQRMHSSKGGSNAKGRFHLL
jgi:hypothetical protein